MIDLHSHILPGIDDGSRSIEMTCGMLSALRQQGVETVVATPHFYAHQDAPDAFLTRRAEAFAQVEGENIPNILLGAEVAYFDGISRCQEMTDLCLGNSRLLLVEMPWNNWTHRMVEEICDMRANLGVTPVLAHVDRYRSQMDRYAPQLLDNQVLFQCNADAFLPWFRRKWAMGLFAAEQVHFLGSDAHNLTTRPPQMGQAVQILTKKFGAHRLQEMTSFARMMLNET